MRILIVKYRTPQYIAAIVWFFGWLTIFQLISKGEGLPKNSPGWWFDVIFWTLLLAVNGLLGPFMTLKYSLSVRVLGDQIFIRKYFGLKQRHHTLRDVARASLTGGSGIRQKLELIFADGDKLIVSAYASKFQDFHELFAMRSQN